MVAVQCPDDASCDLKPECICPGCCKKNHVCTGCPEVSVILDAAGKLHTTCIAAETVIVVTGHDGEVVPRTLSLPEASITATSSSLTSPSSSLPMSESLPSPSASSQQGQAALQRSVVRPFAWLGRLVSSLPIRLAQALPIKMRESSAAGRVYGHLLESEIVSHTGSQSAAETLDPSSSSSGHTHHKRSIGDDWNKHQHFHHHAAVENLNATTATNTTTTNSSRSVLPVSVTATAWFTMTTTSTTTVFSTQAAAETTKTCDLRRRRGL